MAKYLNGQLSKDKTNKKQIATFTNYQEIDIKIRAHVNRKLGKIKHWSVTLWEDHSACKGINVPWHKQSGNTPQES